MKTILVAMGIVAAGSLSAFAAEPVKMMDAKMGKVMTTPKGMTLCTFDKDTKDKSNCDAKCLKNWPAFHADAEATAEDEWTLVKDADGKDMLAYEGKPLHAAGNQNVASQLVRRGSLMLRGASRPNAMP
jgi:predicted lipoprotein with Yx(FWY)xxD motif